jgi:hypothetical protein
MIRGKVLFALLVEMFFLFSANCSYADCSYFGQNIKSNSTLVINGDTLWCDNYGGIWASSRAGMDFNTASSMCDNLNYAGHKGLGTWVLPTSDQLYQCAASSTCHASSVSIGWFWTNWQCSSASAKRFAFYPPQMGGGGSSGGCRFKTDGSGARCRLADTANGVCGSAVRVFGTSMTSYSGYSQCSVGFPSSTQIPEQGKSVTWTCSGVNGGGSSPLCIASKSYRPCVIPDDFNKSMIINGQDVWCGASANVTWTSTVSSGVTWDKASSVCSNLNYAGYGPGSWYLPSVDEYYICSLSSSSGCRAAPIQWARNWAQGSYEAFIDSSSGLHYGPISPSYVRGVRCKLLDSVSAPCGSSDKGNFTSVPTINLCSWGIPSVVAGSGPWTWTCSPGDTKCSAFKKVDGMCGTATRTFAYNETGYGSYTQCSPGTATNTAFPAQGASVTWTCNGINGGASSTTCTASRAAAPVNGLCGTAVANYSVSQSAYTGSFCNGGTALPSSPAFPALGASINWICQGLYGGTNILCSATRAANAVCPAIANYASAPTPTCTTGTPGVLSGGNPWLWPCIGINGGSNELCIANKVMDGACGSNATNYPYNTTGYTGSFCGSGTPNPATPSFPLQGGNTTWTCSGTNGGLPSGTCTAARANNPISATGFKNPFDYVDASTQDAKEQCIWCDYYYKETTDTTTTAGKRGSGLDFGFTYSDQSGGRLSSYSYVLTSVTTTDPDTVPLANKIQGTVTGLSIVSGGQVNIQGFSMTTGALNSSLKQIPYNGGKTYDLWVKVTNNNGQSSPWIKSDKPFSVTDHKWPKVAILSSKVQVNVPTQFCSTAKAAYNGVKDPCLDLCWVRAAGTLGVTDQEFSFTDQILQAKQLESSSWKCSVCYDNSGKAILCQNAPKKEGEISNFEWDVIDPMATKNPYFPTFSGTNVPSWWKYGKVETNGINTSNPVIQFLQPVTDKAKAKLKIYGSECPLQAGINSKTIRPIWIEN